MQSNDWSRTLFMPQTRLNPTDFAAECGLENIVLIGYPANTDDFGADSRALGPCELEVVTVI